MATFVLAIFVNVGGAILEHVLAAHFYVFALDAGHVKTRR